MYLIVDGSSVNCVFVVGYGPPLSVSTQLLFPGQTLSNRFSKNPKVFGALLDISCFMYMGTNCCVKSVEHKWLEISGNELPLENVSSPFTLWRHDMHRQSLLLASVSRLCKKTFCTEYPNGLVPSQPHRGSGWRSFDSLPFFSFSLSKWSYFCCVMLCETPAVYKPNR